MSRTSRWRRGALEKRKLKIVNSFCVRVGSRVALPLTVSDFMRAPHLTPARPVLPKAQRPRREGVARRREEAVTGPSLC